MTITLTTPSAQSPKPDEERWTPNAASMVHVKRATDSSSSELADLPHALPPCKSSAELALVKKIHWHVLPFVFGCVFIQCKSIHTCKSSGGNLTLLFFCVDADKAVLSAAAVLGMVEDCDITPTQYSILGSVFYIGFIVFQMPNNYFIQRVPSISKYLGTLLTIWGLVLALTSQAKSFVTLAVLRVLLGLFEAAT